MGPDHWGSLNPNFTRCAMGTNQSPIDIVTEEAVYDSSMEPLHRNYTVANATIVDNVVNIGVSPPEQIKAHTVSKSPLATDNVRKFVGVCSCAWKTARPRGA